MGPSGHLCTHMQIIPIMFLLFLIAYCIHNKSLWKSGKHELPLDKHTVVHLRICVFKNVFLGKVTPSSKLQQQASSIFLRFSKNRRVYSYLRSNGFVVSYVIRLIPHACTLGLKSLASRLTFRCRYGQ